MKSPKELDDRVRRELAHAPELDKRRPFPPDPDAPAMGRSAPPRRSFGGGPHDLFLVPSGLAPPAACPRCSGALLAAAVELVAGEDQFPRRLPMEGLRCPACALLLAPARAFVETFQWDPLSELLGEGPEPFDPEEALESVVRVFDLSPGHLDRRTRGRRPKGAPAPIRQRGYLREDGPGVYRLVTLEEDRAPPVLPSAEEVGRLPLAEEEWQVLAARLPVWVEEKGKPRRPYGILVLDATNDFILYQETLPDSPTPSQVFEALLKAMARPHSPKGGPRRPQLARVEKEDWAAFLAPQLGALGVACEPGPLPEARKAWDSLHECLHGRPPTPGLLEFSRATAEQVGAFFSAAAHFYRRAPWKRFPFEQPIAVRVAVSPWRYVTVVGIMGQNFGLTVSDDLDALRRLRDPATGPEEKQEGNLHVMFEEIQNLPFADHDDLEVHGWELAGPRAYPVPLRLEGPGTGRASAEELAWLEAVLRTLPDFIERHFPSPRRPPAPGEDTVTVATLHGPARVASVYPVPELEEPGVLYRFSARRRGRTPRTIEIRGDQTLADLDQVLRASFRLDPGDHMGGFWIGRAGRAGQHVGDVDPAGRGDGALVRLGDLRIRSGDELTYVYDFGDWVEHRLRLEGLGSPEKGSTYPRQPPGAEPAGSGRDTQRGRTGVNAPRSKGRAR